MAVGVRAGRREDAEFLAWVMLSASRAHLRRGTWNLLIGADEAGCLDYLRRLAVAEPRSLCHYESFLVAEVDGKPGAALCGGDLRAGGWEIAGQAMSNVQRELEWTDADTAALEARFAPVWNCFPPAIEADWCIENVATLPEFRRRGLAGMLIDHALRQGRERGCKLAQLTTSIGNEAAQSVYRKRGFRFSDEKRCEEMLRELGTPGFVRLVADL